MSESIEKYLISKGWEFNFKKGEYWLTACPLNECGPGHFSINADNEFFKCFKCQEGGHLLSLKKRLGDLPAVAHISETKKNTKKIPMLIIEKYQKSLLDAEYALSYLRKNRGFSIETIKKFKLGMKDSMISIPFFRDGECLLLKWRPIKPTGEKYLREEGCESILFNLDNALKFKNSIIVTEGEFDAMAYDQMGFPNVVSVPTGADSIPENGLDDLENFNEIYLSWDMDESGRKGIEKISEKLGKYRCLNILLPLKDANDCLMAGFNNQEMGEILVKAIRWESTIVKRTEAFMEEVLSAYGDPINIGFQTHWNEFNRLIGGVRPDELTVVTGETGSGKSTWCSNLAYGLAQIRHPVLLAGFEMKPIKIILKMIQMKGEKFWRSLTKEKYKECFKYVMSLPIYHVDIYGEIGTEKLKDAIYYAKRRFDIEIIILDHLHFFLKYSADHERQAIDQALRDIKSWAMNLNIHIFLIVHPTKLEKENKEVGMNDLKGSSGLKQIPDNIISIYRKRMLESPDEDVLISLLKVRDDAGNEGKFKLKFKKQSQSYEDER